MPSGTSFHNHLLIAMPGMADPNFSSTVTLVCEHSDDGALGIVINRPTTLNVSSLFEQLALDSEDERIGSAPVLQGGPVAPDRGFVIHPPTGEFENSVEVSADLHLTLSRDVLDAMAAGDGPEQSLVALGYAGWNPGQLEDEIMLNSWLTVPASPEIVFEVPFAERWSSAAESMGIDISTISPDVGACLRPLSLSILACDELGLRSVSRSPDPPIRWVPPVTAKTGPDWQLIGSFINVWRPARLIVGMPYHADGSESELSEHVVGFMRELERFELPVVAVDERYSSVEAEARLKALRAAGLSKRISKEMIDAAAAVTIAERWLAG